MTIEKCPNCGQPFDSQKCRYTGGPLSYFRPRWPDEQLDHQFTVRCPHCRIAYVSGSVKFLGFATRKTFVPWMGILILLVVVFGAYIG